MIDTIQSAVQASQANASQIIEKYDLASFERILGIIFKNLKQNWFFPKYRINKIQLEIHPGFV